MDQFNNLRIATKYDGVLKRDGGTGQWTPYNTANNPAIFTSNRVNAIAAAYDPANPTLADPTTMTICI